MDTNILLRIAQTTSPQSAIATRALESLRSSNAELCLCAQNLCEFWVVATRPLDVNGLGLGVTDAINRLDLLLAAFEVLYESDQVFGAWRHLIEVHQVSGKSAHDARIAAAMTTNGVSNILTFNASDFARFPGITPIDPATVSNPAPGTS